MKNNILIIAVFLSSSIAFAQTKEESKLFNSDGTPKHSLSLNLGAHPFSFNGLYENAGPSLSITYNRHFKNNHTLRTGLRFQSPGQIPFPSQLFHFITLPSELDVTPQTYVMHSSNDYVRNNKWVGLEIGYEKLFGNRIVKPLLGVSLYGGYQNLKLDIYERSWRETRTYDPITQTHTILVNPLTNGSVQTNSHRVFLGIMPRVGFNVDISKRFAMAFVLNPYIGYSHTLKRTDRLQGDRPILNSPLKSNWSALANAEINLTFKITPPPPRKKK